MPIADWKEFFPHTVSLEAVATRDNYGKPATYATAVEYNARVVYRTTRVPAAVEGGVALASGYVWIQGTPIPALDDKLTLPDSSTPGIMKVDTFPDEDGDHHTKIYFGGMKSIGVGR